MRGDGSRHRCESLQGGLLGGWGSSIPTHAISAYVDDARSAGAYLQPGDQVTSHVDYLGAIRNQVTR